MKKKEPIFQSRRKRHPHPFLEMLKVAPYRLFVELGAAGVLFKDQTLWEAILI